MISTWASPAHVFETERQRRPGPKQPNDGIPAELWPTVVQRVVEQKESLRTVAATYGVSHETIRCMLLYTHQQMDSKMRNHTDSVPTTEARKCPGSKSADLSLHLPCVVSIRQGKESDDPERSASLIGIKTSIVEAGGTATDSTWTGNRKRRQGDGPHSDLNCTID